MRDQAGRAGRILAAIAGRQKGIATHDQLLAAGLSPWQTHRLALAGHLIRIHRGVYLVGHRAVHPLAYETAAILACRPRAMLSFNTSARLLELPVRGDGMIHVTLVDRWRPAPAGVRLHVIAAVADSELRRHHGLPIASTALTLLDLAGVLGHADWVRALNEARVKRLVTERELEATLAAHPNRRGARLMRRHLASERGPRITRSEAERLALEVMRDHGLEPDATQYRIGPYRVDFYFEPERVAVEVEGRRFHDTPMRFVDDRRRVAFLAARGVQVFPLTWHDLHGGAADAMARLRQTLVIRRSPTELIGKTMGL